VLSGSISTFDDRRGDGVFVTDDGERLYFHCLDIADGTRSIPFGARAHAERAVGHVGRDDARNITADVEPVVTPK
jgi:cold shock CspA family protein